MRDNTVGLWASGLREVWLRGGWETISVIHILIYRLYEYCRLVSYTPLVCVSPPPTSHFNLFNKDTHDLFMLWIMLVCHLLLCIIVIVVQFTVCLYSTFVHCSFDYFFFIQLSLFFVHQKKYSILILDCIPGILIPFS